MDRSDWKLLAGALAGTLVGMSIRSLQGKGKSQGGGQGENNSLHAGSVGKEEGVQPKPNNGYFPSAQKDERDWYVARIEPEASRLMQNEVSQAHLIITLLSGANAGGAIAVLAYMAQLAEKPAKFIPHSTWVLTLFGTGFILSLFLAVNVYYASLYRLREWSRNTGAFYRGEILWRALWESRKERWYWSRLPYLFAWASLICFLVGAGWGLRDMLLAVPSP